MLILSRLTAVAVLCLHVLCEEEYTEEEMIDQIWKRFVPGGSEYMNKDQLFELMNKTMPEALNWESLVDWEQLVEGAGGDPDKGLTKEQFHKIHTQDQSSVASLKEDHKTLRNKNEL
eukprot:gnl/MRDRNA2_/MRDRNA2_32605_c0_seq1.p1 gnl/MRDRNA2_/MRDRNA2_32605_c0~~gnl/MRDRNA2_/MRDRNA2_32605_c0_seq1.p1  ORF type:complete len:117 (+),score=18.16 gnl/MRDRNA2_/MRDRNA2_32605_c0_seq1:95-445(+)